MNKMFFSLAVLAMMAMPTVAQAQENGEDTGETPVYANLESGYFRFVNNGYGDVLSTDGKHKLSIRQTENSARTMPSTIFYYDTNGVYSFADDVAQYGDNLTVADLMYLMATTAWKSGSYSTYDITSQGISFGGYLQHLRDYVYAALEDFPQSEAVKNFYESGIAWYLMVAMSSAFTPADMETLDTFRAAVDRYMKRWKNYFDFNVYLKPAENVDHGFMLHFHAPMDISKVKDTQEQINSMSDPDTGEPYGFNFDFFGAFKDLVIEEAAKELDEEGVAYVKRIIDPLVLDYEYFIGENEQGELYVVGLSREAMFGENGELAALNQDELLWIVQPVDEVNPLQVEMNVASTNGYWSTMFTEFPYQLGEGVEAYYVVADGDNGAKLAPVSGGKVPAMTAVVLHSQHRSAVSNVLIPINEELPAIEGNLLKGTCLPMELAEPQYVLGSLGNSETIAVGMVVNTTTVAANSCYLDREWTFAEGVSGISNVLSSTTGAQTCFDLQGRRVAQPVKGVYVVNGKKVVK